MGFACEPSRLWIVTEYCSRGSLRDVLDADEALSERRLLKIALGAARGLAYLHGQNPPVLHLDLKPSNILISSGWEAKLGDFGLSRNVTNIERDSFSGTMQYTAPEILQANAFSTAADVYSFGVCLWEMAVGDIPFKDISPTSVIWGVVKSARRPPLNALNVKNRHVAPVPAGCQEQSPRSFPHNTILVKQSADYVSQALRCTQSRDTGSAKSRNIPDVPPFPSSGNFATKQGESTSASVTMPSSIMVNAASPKGQMMEPKDRSATAENSFARQDNCLGEESVSSPHLVDWLVKGEKPCEGMQIGDLQRRVTATIRKFDDRPPIARQMDETPRPREVDMEAFNDSSLVSRSSKLRSRLKTVLQARATAEGVTEGLQEKIFDESDGTCDPNTSTEEGDAFSRRLANFAQAQPEKNVEQSAAAEVHRESPQSASTKGPPCDSAPHGTAVPRQYSELIEKCWAQDPSERPSASEIVWMLMLIINGD